MKKKRIIIIIISSIVIIIAAFIIAGLFSEKKDESYAMKINGTIISPEVYKTYVIQKTLLAGSMVADFGKEFMAQKIEDTLVPDWIRAKTNEQIIYDYVIKEEFDKEKIKVYDSDKERLDTYLEQQWEMNKSVFINNKCNREKFDQAYQSFLYTDLLFDKFSKENPLEEKEVRSKSATVKYFMMNKYGLEGNKFTEAQVGELIKLANDYVHQLSRKKTIEEVYKSYLIKMGEELLENRMITASVISVDNKEYTSKIPKFVEALMKAKAKKPFYAEDEYYITVGIRQKDTDNKAIQKAYEESAETNALRTNFDEFINAIIKKVNVEVNEYIVKKYSPDSIRYDLSES